MNSSFVIPLEGRIDSNNASEVEKNIDQLRKGKESLPLILDASGLEYISSAGLRVLLHLKKTAPDMTITEVSSEVYDILDMTGFTEMMKVEKAFRQISIDGCEEIGRGANGSVYRIDQDNIVKVYRDSDALEEIRHEREVARLALILGIPTAISYDVVRVGDSYGSVFELLNATSFSKILAREPDRMDWVVKEYIELLRTIHGTIVPEGKLPDMKETVRSWVLFLKDYLPEDSWQKLLSLVEAVPEDHHMIHGDYHTKNVMVQNEEVLLIDMDTLAAGHPIFELASMYNAFIGFSELDPGVIVEFQGFDFATSRLFWDRVLAEYLGTAWEKRIRDVEDKARIIGYTRMIRRLIRRNGLHTEQGQKEIAYYKKELVKLLETTDTLLFAGAEFKTEAKKEHLPLVLAFIDQYLEGTDASSKTRNQMHLIAEEIFVNITEYAYREKPGDVILKMELSEDGMKARLTFMDQGIAYNPLEKEDPDLTLGAEERPIGGLGIYLTRKQADELSYEYKNGSNVLSVIKHL
ncbi:MAG: anti-sigma factor antagonist [Parasporobacterium sp.]|nr:anti-sigma factor antagonist [Parasporobacterium sp.]